MSKNLIHWVGRRVEIPVHYDLWMRGARFGRVTAFRKGKPGLSACLLVKMDHPQVRRSVKVWALDVPYMKDLSLPPYVNWSARAEEAEQAGDWVEAKHCWYRAAQALNGNPDDLRTKYGQREDAAAARIQEQKP